MGRNRAIVDNPPAHRLLAAHLAKRSARCQKHARQIHIQTGKPIVQRNLINQPRWCKYPSIVEQHIQPSRPVHQLRDRCFYCLNIRDIARQDHGVWGTIGHHFQRRSAAGKQTNRPTFCQKQLGHGAANAGTGSGYQDTLGQISSPPWVSSCRAATGAARRSST